jgi:hypothetical protein
MDWRIIMGLSPSLLWLLPGALYISTGVSCGGFVQWPAEELGSFMEGAFAPLAFLWLVIGYFLQQQELIQNTQALRAQAGAIGRTARLQLGGISGMLYIPGYGDQADYPLPEDSSHLLAEQSMAYNRRFTLLELT